MHKTSKKIKATAAKLQSKWCRNSFRIKLLIMGQSHTTLMENANLFFTNNGTKPLILQIHKVHVDVQYRLLQEPIAPGGKEVIGVQYATDRVGAFTKQLL
jgi:hypothetical protein